MQPVCGTDDSVDDTPLQDVYRPLVVGTYRWQMPAIESNHSFRIIWTTDDTCYNMFTEGQKNRAVPYLKQAGKGLPG